MRAANTRSLCAQLHVTDNAAPVKQTQQAQMMCVCVCVCMHCTCRSACCDGTVRAANTRSLCAQPHVIDDAAPVKQTQQAQVMCVCVCTARADVLAVMELCVLQTLALSVRSRT